MYIILQGERFWICDFVWMNKRSSRIKEGDDDDDDNNDFGGVGESTCCKLVFWWGILLFLIPT
jgi:hypothetical protein